MHLHLKTLCFPLIFLLAITLQAQGPSNAFKRIQKQVEKICEEKKIPSLAMYIHQPNDSLAFTYHNEAVQPQEIYGIGSTTKMLASILIFKLIEAEEIALDDPVEIFIPQIKTIEGWNILTLQHLLNHTSGISDYTQHPQWIRQVMQGKAPQTFEEKFALVHDTLGKVGTFAYSNSNFLLLEQVVESVTEKAFEAVWQAFYKEHGFPTIQMGNDQANLEGYFGQTLEQVSNVSSWKEYYGFDGGAYIRPAVMNQLMQRIFWEKHILTDRSIEQMKAWVPMGEMTIPIGKGQITSYGHGLMKLVYKNKAYIGHMGSTLQYQSFVFVHEKEQTRISLFTNCSGPYFNRIFFQEIVPTILDKL
ncbi:MAG: serine hydrolase domain-containing protein [Bacteroidota bacterium]